MAVSPQDHSPFAVVFDLEFTAWEGSQETNWLRPGEHRELVQIGAVKVDSAFLPVAEFDQLIRPRLNPELSNYMQTLTGITNGQIRARGVDFVEAHRNFLAFAEGLPLFAFGRDDLVIADNIRLYGLREIPPMSAFHDLRRWLQAQGIDTMRRNFRACNVGPAAGVPFKGQTHNGLADAHSVAAGVAALMLRGAPPPAGP